MMVDETVLFYGGQKDRSQMMMLEEIHARPHSVINIIEIPDASEANPQPDNETEKQLGEFISAQKLKEIGGVSNLFDLQELTVKVDTSETSIGNVGSMAPNLKKLNLNNSFIMSVRDLGTCLNNLNTLWLSRCCLQELDGISCISTLKELFVAYNEIFDLSPLSMLENIEVLDLEGNNIDDVTQLEFLSLCAKLKVLTTKGNPVEHSPTPSTDVKDLKYYSYRDAILSCLPQLTMLDDERFLEEIIDGKKVKRNNPKPQNNRNEHFKDDLQIISDSLKAIETDVDENTIESQESSTARPLSARLRNQSAISSQSGISNGVLKLSPEKNTDDAFQVSELTHGVVLCGNPVQALRKRATKKQQKTTPTKPTRTRSSPAFKPEHSYLSVEEDAMEKDDVFEQLKVWRLQNKSLFGDGDELSITCASDTTRISSPVYSPSPPSAPKPNQTSSRTRRSLGIERPAMSERPSTAADFRQTVFEGDSDEMSSELEVIDEDTITSCEKAPVGLKNDTTPVRPFTARAALQTSNKILNCKVKDDT